MDPRWLLTTGTPWKYFQIANDKIGVYPKASGDGGILEVTVVSIPNAYEEDTSRIFLRDAFKRGVVHLAVSEYWASRGDAREALKHHQMYLRVVGVANLLPSSNEDKTQLVTRQTG